MSSALASLRAPSPPHESGGFSSQLSDGTVTRHARWRSLYEVGGLANVAWPPDGGRPGEAARPAG